MEFDYFKALVNQLNKNQEVIFKYKEYYVYLQTHTEEDFEYSLWIDELKQEPDDGGFINLVSSKEALEELIQRLQ